MTLLEVVIAMLILSIALAGLAIAFPVARIAVNEGGQYTVAANLAQDAIEKLRRLTLTPVVLGPMTGDVSSNALFSTPTIPSGYQRTVLIEDLEILGGVWTLKRVTVNVTFSLQGSNNVTAILQTLIAR
jgi:type II secretory pathway pseudopilin PulG